ncbi:MAG: tetratricopeptide repeat protein [Thermodesulfobacteriota bacterium]|nr:tetratricopeptide repeat protein [Thermodesulfobacteriota bacterium]
MVKHTTICLVFLPMPVTLTIQLLLFFLFSAVSISCASEAVLKKVSFKTDPAAISLDLTEKVPAKVIKVDRKEVMIALKNIRSEKPIDIKGPLGGLIKRVAVENLPGKVTAVLVTGNRDFQDILPEWSSSGLNFKVTFLGDKDQKEKLAEAARKGSDKKKSDEPGKSLEQKKKLSVLKPKSVPKPERKQKSSPSAAFSVKTEGKPVKKEKPIYAGDTSDLLKVIDISQCRSELIQDALVLMKKQFWDKAFDGLNKYIDKGGDTCREQAFFMRAYACSMRDQSNSENLIQAADFLNDALAAFPDSKLTPFALSFLGKINLAMKNPALAQGYFSMIRDRFPDYPGMAEVFYFLGKIYGDRGYTEQSLNYYEKVFRKFPENTYTVDAGLGVGKGLYNKRHYIDALSILSRLVSNHPEKAYDSPEMLLNIANASLKLGKTGLARDNFTRVCNLFSDFETRDMVLSTIGDTFAKEGKYDKAMSLYQFVRDKYPGSEGFLASSMGLARYLDNREEREQIYNMIIQGFPEHRYARMAMMRLAEIYDQAGEFEKCIKQIEDLLATHPRALRYEAVKLMQKAYESLFDEKLKSDEYPDILHRYEAEQVMIDRMESRKIFLKVGLAYLAADFYEQAFNQLIKSYKLYKRSQRPSALLFGLARAMAASSRDVDALKMFNGFIKRFPGNKHVPRAHGFIGEIHLAKNDFNQAANAFARAEQAEKDHFHKGRFLVKKAEVFKREKKWADAAVTLTRAAEEIAASSEPHYRQLVDTYQKLGRSYIEQDLYVKGAEAFTLALKFSGKVEKRADISFAIGDAYQKANVLKKARKVFERVAASDDSVWARLARERLSTIELAQKMRNS